MAVLLTQSWDVIQGKEDEYRTFITSEFLPGLAATGLAPVGGYFVEVGTGPRIIAVQRGTDTDELCRVFGETEFKQMVLRLKSLVGHYRAALLEPLGKMKQEDYTIPGGAWKFNQYYDLRPGMKREYGRYVMDEYHRKPGLCGGHGRVERDPRRRQRDHCGTHFQRPDRYRPNANRSRI
jgi:hypothetical protein